MAKNYEIKFKLGADMESSFAKTFSGASKDFKELQQQLKGLNGVKGRPNMTQHMRDDLSKTRKAFSLTQTAGSKMVSSLKVAGGALAGAFAVGKVVSFGKDIVQTYANFEQSMANVKAVSGTTGEDFAKLSAKAREMGERTSKTASEAADGLQYLALAGWNTEQMLAGIEPVLRLSEAGAMDLGRASDLATDSMAALGLGVKDLPAYLDKVAQTSRRSNTSVEQLMDGFLIAGGTFKTFNVPLEEATSLLGTLANRGFKGTEAGTAMNAIVTNLTSGLGQSGKAMKKLKISAFDAKGNFKGLENVFREVKAKIDPMTDAQKAQYISMIAGKEHLKTFTGILDGLGNEYGNLKKEVTAADGALMEMANTQMDTFTGSMKLLESAVESAKISIGERLAPTIRRFADNLANWIPKAMGQLDKLMAGPEWKNADFFGKIKLSWNKLIGEPLSKWWESDGRALVSKIGKEAGSLLWSGIKGLGKEALSFNGGSSMLAATALGVPAAKIGKTTKGLFSFGKAGKTAASSMGLVARSASLVGPAIGALANPVGAVLLGVGALAGGWWLYRKHQEKARQELLNMHKTFDKTLGDYKTAVEGKKRVDDLITEYDRLTAKIKDAKTPAAQLTEARRKLADVERELIDLNPDILRAEDAKSDSFRTQLDQISKLKGYEVEEKKRALESQTIQQQQDLPRLIEEYGKLKEKQQEYNAAFLESREKFYEFKGYSDKHQNILHTSKSEAEKEKRFNDLFNEIQAATGKTFHGSGGAGLGGELANFQKDMEKYRENWQETNGEIAKVEETVAGVVKNQKDLIELDMGAPVDELIAKYQYMGEEEKRMFQEKILQLSETNNLLGKEIDKTVNISVIWQQIGEMPTFSERKNQLNNIATNGFEQYADGGIATKPSIFGEAGPEIAIPIDNKPRSQSLLDVANRLIGRSSSNDSSSSYNVTFAPQITVQGGGSDVESRLAQALSRAQDDFERRFREMMRQERRLSFNG
ncbi:phage tail tape measure protein [Paenibacillus sp. GCM10027626]|uniref:phage tail tape measure protein n=1 Tax=Paenibacillus sp. GCM10027626 TaxID=3273411 RepID=UPI003626A376